MGRWNVLRGNLRGRGKGGRDRRSDRGAVELGVALLGGVLVVGAVAGNGVASTALSTSDGSTWLADGSTGQVVQLDPTSARVDQRLQVGADGSVLDIAQANGYLVVTDADGNITSIDLSTLLASGQRSVDAAADVRVLIGKGQLYLADVTNGTLRAVNPLTLADLGEPYRSRGLTDAVVDGKGTIWIVDGKAIKKLHWDADARRFVVEQTKKLQGVGGRTRLTAHAQGVSVFAPDGGAIVQLGTGRKDLAVAVRSLEGEVAAAPNAPADLVPASMTSEGRVAMISGRKVLSVAVKDIGCARPGTPAVFAGKVYVPCLGDRRVIALNRDGRRAGSDVMVQGSGDPQLLVDEGHLIVQSGDKTSTVIVNQDGSSRTVDIAAQGGKARTVKQKPKPPSNRQWSKPPATRQQDADAPKPGRTKSPGTGRDGTSGGTGTDRCTGKDCAPIADPCPAGSTDPACAQPDPNVPAGDGEDPGGDARDGRPVTAIRATATGSQVEVTWTPPTGRTPTSIEVTSSSPTSGPNLISTRVAGTATRATLTGVRCESNPTVDVVAHYSADWFQVARAPVSMPECAAAPPVSTDPVPVANLKARAGAATGYTAVTLTWDAPAVAPDYYLVKMGDGAFAQWVAPAANSASFYQVLTDDVVPSYEVISVRGDKTATARVALSRPAKVTELRATANVGSGRIDVTFKKAADTGNGTTEYYLWCLSGDQTIADFPPTKINGLWNVGGGGIVRAADTCMSGTSTVAVAASDSRGRGPAATVRVYWPGPGTGEAALRNPGVQVTPAPWVAPEVTNPPMLGAGIALIVPVAGLWSWRGIRRLRAGRAAT